MKHGRPTNTWLAALALGAAAGSFSAIAADDVVIPATAANDRPAATDPTVAPAPQRFGNVEVVNGGVDSDRAAAIKRLAPQYKLRIELSGAGGEYRVADRLQVRQKGQVITAVPNAGPLLLIDVPPGQYTLVSEFADKQVTRNINVAANGTTVHWVMPASVN